MPSPSPSFPFGRILPVDLPPPAPSPSGSGLEILVWNEHSSVRTRTGTNLVQLNSHLLALLPLEERAHQVHRHSPTLDVVPQIPERKAAWNAVDG